MSNLMEWKLKWLCYSPLVILLLLIYFSNSYNLCFLILGFYGQSINNINHYKINQNCLKNNNLMNFSHSFLLWPQNILSILLSLLMKIFNSKLSHIIVDVKVRVIHWVLPVLRGVCGFGFWHVLVKDALYCFDIFNIIQT